MISFRSSSRLLVAAALLLGLSPAAAPAAASAAETATAGPVRINVGGPAVTDGRGQRWLADRYLNGAAGHTWDSGKAVRSATPVVDRSERVGDFSYRVPVPAVGSYTLRLHLTELYWSRKGQRMFDVTVEGRTLARGLDILATRAPLQTKVLEVPLTVRDGAITVKLRSRVDKASLTGLEVLPRDARPATTPTPTPTPTQAPTQAPSPPAAAPAPAPTTAPPAAGPGRTSSGPPTTSARGSFAERPATRTYSLTGLQAGRSGDAAANVARFRQVLDSARAGDVITVAPGHYRLGGTVDFTRADITLKGLGATREDVWFESTDERRASWRIKAGGIHLQNLTHRVHATARSSLAQMGEGNIWVEGGHRGFRMQDVLAWGSRDAAVFLYGVHDWQLNRVESRDSRSDAYHVSQGSSGGTFYDCVSRDSGDDGVGIVGYGREGAGTPHHVTVVRHHVDGQSWGRGIGLVHVHDITVVGPTLIEDTAGAGIIMAREPQYGSGSVRDVRVLGELRLRRVNKAPQLDHGAIHLHNASTDGAIERVVVTGPVLAVDTGVNRPGGVSYQVRAGGPGRIDAEVAGARFYGSGPRTLLSLGLAPGSAFRTPGWGASDGYRGAEPPETLTFQRRARTAEG